MKARLLTGWNFQRVAFVALGLLVIGTSISEQQWVGLLFGGYFVTMGLFALGCAGGNCGVAPRNPVSYKTDEVEFEEIKSN